MTLQRWTGLILVLFLAQEVTAQNQRIGYVDTERILEQLPEYQGIEERLEMMARQWRDELNELEEVLETERRAFDERRLLYDEEMIDSERERLGQMEDRLDRLLHERFGPNGDYFEQQRRLLEPLQEQVFRAIERVAEEGGYDMVFDRAGEPRMLFARDEWDLTEEVLQRLGAR